MKAYGRIGMKLCTNKLSYMTKMTAMPICGKNLYKSSSPEQWRDGLGTNYLALGRSTDDLGMTLAFTTARSNMGKW